MTLRIIMIDQMDTEFVMDKNKAISSIAKTIKKIHIHKNMQLVYKQDYYKDKHEEINDLLLNTWILSCTILIILR